MVTVEIKVSRGHICKIRSSFCFLGRDHPFCIV